MAKPLTRKGKRLLEEQSDYVYRYWHSIEIKHKDSNLITQHHSIWKEEYYRLESIQQKLYCEMCNQFLNLTSEFPNCKSLNEFLSYGKSLEMDMYKYETEVIYSNWELRDSIKRWLSLPENQRSNPELLEIQLLVASQENQVTFDSLNNEYICCDEEIKIMKNNSGMVEDEEDVSYHNDKILPYFEELDFPDAQVKSALLEVLENINHKYMQRQKNIHKDFHRHKNPGLGEIATPVIKHIIGCYPPNLINRKLLYMDCLRRIFPTKSLNELIIQERWIEACRLYSEQNKQCIEDWTRELWTWLLHSAATCSKEQQLHLKGQKNKDEIEKQKAICDDLKKKVEHLREEKRIKVKFLDEMDKRKLVKSQMKELEKTKKELERRQMEKIALRHYYETTLRKKKEEEMAALAELQNIKRQNKERMKKSMRMQFRSKMICNHSKTVSEKLLELDTEEV